MTKAWTPDWNDEPDELSVLQRQKRELIERNENQAETIRTLKTENSKLRAMLEACHVSPNFIDKALENGS